MAKITIYKDFSLGINNVDDPDTLAPNRAGQRYVADSANYDHCADGTLRTRMEAGPTSFDNFSFPGGNALWYRGAAYTMGVQGDDMVFYRIHPSTGLADVIWRLPVKSIESRNANIIQSGVEHAGKLYFTIADVVIEDPNQADHFVRYPNALVYDGITVSPWGVSELQPTAATISVTPYGVIPPGMYQISLARVQGGVAGPATAPTVVTLAATGAIVVSYDFEEASNSDGPMDYVAGYIPTDQQIYVYITPCNASTAYLNAVLTQAHPSATIASIQTDTEELSVDFTRSPFQTSVMESHNASIYLVEGTTLWMTRPMMPHLIDAVSGFFQFPDSITDVVSTDDGLYISADRVYFLATPETIAASLRDAHELPCAPGSMRRLTNGNVVWLSEVGVVVGDSSGQIKEVTRGYYRPERIQRVKTGVVFRDGQELVFFLPQSSSLPFLFY